MGLLTKRNETEPAPPLARKKKARIGEISTSWARDFIDGIRSFRRTFWPSAPSYPASLLSYSAARAIYSNTDKKSNLAAGFGRRIINSTQDFLDLPRADSGDEVVDEFLNKTIRTYWNAKIMEAVRDACRDAETVVRIRRHDPENPLVSAEEWESCYLEVVPPETVSIFYKEGGDELEIEVAYIRHEFQQRVEAASTDNGRTLRAPSVRQHVIIEELTPEKYRYYDETDGRWRDDLEQPNSWGFVPLVEMFNEYDNTIKSGRSDLEPVLPFIMAFHDVMGQALIAHKAHSIPKAKFKVNDLMQFIANNWPESFDKDENGQLIVSSFSGNISWKGTEMLFFGPEEDGGFMEVQSALGDSKTLLDFLLTCISITSEVPKAVLMNALETDADEMIPFAKKINRKRQMFSQYIAILCKMVLAINHMEPIKVPFVWDEITPDIALLKSQVLQQEVMSTEVLATRQVISDDTVRRHITPFVNGMKPSSQEAADAKNNVIPMATSPNSVKGTDAGNTDKPGNEN